MKTTISATLLAVFCFVGSAVAESALGYPYMFYFGVATNNRTIIPVAQPLLPVFRILPQGYIRQSKYFIGADLDLRFFRNVTARHGNELNLAFGLGARFGRVIGENWYVSGGVGLIQSNPLSDDYGGTYSSGYEGDPRAEIVRDVQTYAHPIFEVGRKISNKWWLVGSVRGKSVDVGFGFAPN